jgi:hypothetical protein
MGKSRHNPYMNNPDEFETRLKKADPATNVRVGAPSDQIVSAAIHAKPSLGLIQGFRLLSAEARSFALGGALSGTAAIVALAIVINPGPQPLIQLAHAPQGGENSSAMVSDGAEDKMMSMPYTTYVYKAGPELSNTTGTGQVYKLVRTGNPESVLATVAQAFGVQGSVKKYPDYSNMNPGYFFSASEEPWGMDNVNPIVSLWWTGTGSWNYSAPGQGMSASSDCGELDAEGNCQEWVEVPPTPELLPERSEAISKALEIFNATGLNATEADLLVDYSEWGVYISAALSVAGQSTSMEWYVGWSSTGEISFAGGHSVVAEAVGTYDTISAVQAIDRLDDWRWYGSAATSYYNKYSGASVDSSTRSDQAIEPGYAEGEEMPEPETVTLTIVSSEQVLLSVWDAAGDVWLVPGFILVNDHGWGNSVISLIEGVIALPEPSPVDILPMPEPAPESTESN